MVKNSKKKMIDENLRKSRHRVFTPFLYFNNGSIFTHSSDFIGISIQTEVMVAHKTSPNHPAGVKPNQRVKNKILAKNWVSHFDEGGTHFSN